MNCTADLLLVFEWDETAYGTGRSNIGNGMECIFSVLLLTVPEAILSHKKKLGADQLCSLFTVLLLAAPEAVCPIHK